MFCIILDVMNNSSMILLAISARSVFESSIRTAPCDGLEALDLIKRPLYLHSPVFSGRAFSTVYGAIEKIGGQRWLAANLFLFLHENLCDAYLSRQGTVVLVTRIMPDQEPL